MRVRKHSWPRAHYRRHNVKKILLHITLIGYVAASLAACSLHKPEAGQGIYINPEARAALSCKQLEEKISVLEATPKAEVYNPRANASEVPFILKNGIAAKLKTMRRTAAKKGCYDRPAYIEPIPKPAQAAPAPKLIDTQRQQLSFGQCFSKCKSLTSRTNEQCFDSCR